jgi:hypothetical protein
MGASAQVPGGKQESFGDCHAGAGDLTSLVERAEASSACEIDHVITELKILRERLEATGERVQRELVEYTTLSESTLQSINVISECLRHRFPKAPQS